MTTLVPLVFFISGAAALLFEALWFRQAGIALGNTVWAVSIVTASFMGGLAVGNGMAARFGCRIQRPLLLFSGLECIVGVSGVFLVFTFPAITAVLVPAIRMTENAAALNAVRIAVAFMLLLIPSSAMGATLPLLTRALSEIDNNFGRILGRLYGVNTLGAVAGVLLGELLLIKTLGIRGSGLAAGFLNVSAAAAALLISRRPPFLKGPVARPAITTSILRIVSAAFIAGGLLLALEVVWFRMLQQFIPATSVSFAIMLSVVLTGMGTGSLCGAIWMARAERIHRYAGWVALLSLCTVIGTYTLLPTLLSAYGSVLITSFAAILSLSLALMLAACMLSGLLFTFLGKALHEEVGENAWASGTLSLGNTVGAMLGALAGGFVLLPHLGVEHSLLLLALGYMVVALLLPSSPPVPAKLRLIAWGAAIGALLLFPFGLMNDGYLRLVIDRWSKDGSYLVAMKEGLNETGMVFRRDFRGTPVAYRLVTNSTGMAARGRSADRYMGLYAWLPAAMHPSPKQALLIGYGLGTTARALTEMQTLESIDIVEISADVFRLSSTAYVKEADPLDDPRVRIHLEDGRFFLMTSPDRYDIITAEPPPPKSAGVTNLYSEEYFRLIYRRLNEGGIVTYWLPVYQLEEQEAKSIIRGFCRAFKDCSLWSGSGFEWMLVGGRGIADRVGQDHFSAQWRNPVVAPRLRKAGLEQPEQLGTLFLADADTLHTLLADDPPLSDNYPYRVSPLKLFPQDYAWYLELMDPALAKQRFANSSLISRVWPPVWRERTLAWFPVQGLVNRMLLNTDAFDSPEAFAQLDYLLSKTSLETAVLWRLGTSVAEREIAARQRDADDYELMEIAALGSLARRDYHAAEEGLGRVETYSAHAAFIRQLRVLALGRAGDAVQARRLFTEAKTRYPEPHPTWRYLAERLGVTR